MDRTPPPPRRLHTPPAPLHALSDSYEPYSPRRSTRVAAQRDIHRHRHPSSHESERARRDVTPTATSKRRATARINNFTLSPPSSPISSPQYRSPRSMKRKQPDAGALDSEPELAAPSTARRLVKQTGLLPTPSETPRKRPLETEASLKKTARVLFPQRPANIEEAMPTPRKSRKKELFTLESFANASEDKSEKIQIFTDSKERIPEHDDEEDNPFVSKKAKAKAVPQRSQRAVAESNMVKETINRDEGMVYMFRGRKVFRKYHDAPSPDISGVEEELEDNTLPTNQRMLRRTIGVEAQRPLRRSTVKPRLLFQEEIKEQRRKNGEVTDDEEADTEIEAPAETPSRKRGKHVVPDPEPNTPPPTVRKVKREISFESWSRVKSAHSSSGSVRESKKRSGGPLERGPAKHARSDMSTPASSLGSV
ncbi:hypothetical protein ACEQ8H_001458 [Pleosporales sp. CAS-2024a]